MPAKCPLVVSFGAIVARMEPSARSRASSTRYGGMRGRTTTWQQTRIALRSIRATVDDRMTDTAVIIAGAGPVGLGLACELGLRGVDCMLIEKRDGVVTVPKQSMVSSRNMEFCRRWGVAKEVRSAVWPESHPRDFVYLDNLRGRELMRVKVPSYGQRDPRDFTPEAPCPCPQIYFDPILMGRVKTFPNVAVRTCTALESFRQDD